MREMETKAGVQAILQQWAEVKNEHGTVERRCAQRAQTWPLASNAKLESMESAIRLLRQAVTVYTIWYDSDGVYDAPHEMRTPRRCSR